MTRKTHNAEEGSQKKKAKKEGFTFTDDGCRTELRVGALLILAAVFLWLWLGPLTSMKLFLAGVPLLNHRCPLAGVPGAEGPPRLPVEARSHLGHRWDRDATGSDLP